MLNLLVRPHPAACAATCVRTQLANTRSFYDLLLRCCLSKVGWFRDTRRVAPTLLILRRAVLSAFYPVFKEPGFHGALPHTPARFTRSALRPRSVPLAGSCATPRPYGPAFPLRFGPLTAAPVVVWGTLQSYDGHLMVSTPSTSPARSRTGVPRRVVGVESAEVWPSSSASPHRPPYSARASTKPFGLVCAHGSCPDH
jgi:hypothetical protein